ADYETAEAQRQLAKEQIDAENQRLLEQRWAESEAGRRSAALEEEQERRERAKDGLGPYDDGHNYGWKNPTGPEPSNPFGLGSYDDGHDFGWKKPTETTESATSSTTTAADHPVDAAGDGDVSARTGPPAWAWGLGAVGVVAVLVVLGVIPL